MTRTTLKPKEKQPMFVWGLQLEGKGGFLIPGNVGPHEAENEGVFLIREWNVTEKPHLLTTVGNQLIKLSYFVVVLQAVHRAVHSQQQELCVVAKSSHTFPCQWPVINWGIQNEKEKVCISSVTCLISSPFPEGSQADSRETERPKPEKRKPQQFHSYSHRNASPRHPPLLRVW